uniref:Uncharacterized protein n=1 Tax=Aegilops tauschii TaxID=37682 RepID=N1QY24_AEGTA
MPGLGSGDIKVQVEDERVLVISGERRREEKEDAKYLRMETHLLHGHFIFVLPENADMEKISAACRDGVLTVTVEKLPPPEPKKPKTIQVAPTLESQQGIKAKKSEEEEAVSNAMRDKCQPDLIKGLGRLID